MTVASSGPSAAFFDLDRTLIAGSSAFSLATAARAMKMMPTHELVRDGLMAATFKMRGDHATGAADNARDRILSFIRGQRQDDLLALNERVLPVLLGKNPARGPPPRRHPPPRRAQHVHRLGRTPRDRRTAGHLARHDPRHRHPRRGRRRHLHRPPRRSLLLRAGQGRRDHRDRPLRRARTRPVLRLQRLGERPPHAQRRRFTPSPSTPTPSSNATPAATGGRS